MKPNPYANLGPAVPLLFIAAVAGACSLCCVASVVIQIGG